MPGFCWSKSDLFICLSVCWPLSGVCLPRLISRFCFPAILSPFEWNKRVFPRNEPLLNRKWWPLLSETSAKSAVTPYLEEAPAPVREAAGGIPGQRAGGHVVFPSSGPGDDHWRVCVRVRARVYIWVTVSRKGGPQLCGSKNTFQLWFNKRKFLLWPEPVLWKSCSAGRDSECLFLLSVCQIALNTFTSSCPFPFTATVLLSQALL